MVGGPARDENSVAREVLNNTFEDTMPKGAAKKDDFDVDDKQKRAAKKAKAKRPKGASSAYNIYVAEHRQALAQAEPGLSFGDLSKRVSADWKQLTEDQRRVR